MLSLFQSQGYSASIIHPCYPVDHSATIKMNAVFDSPCSEKYKAENQNSQSSLTIRGGGHYEHCVGNMSKIFSFDSCIFSQCSFDNVFQPNVSGSFVVRPTGHTCTCTITLNQLANLIGTLMSDLFFLIDIHFISCHRVVFCYPFCGHRHSLHSSTFTPSWSGSLGSKSALLHN